MICIKTWLKVSVQIFKENSCYAQIGVNCGSLGPKSTLLKFFSLDFSEIVPDARY